MGDFGAITFTIWFRLEYFAVYASSLSLPLATQDSLRGGAGFTFQDRNFTCKISPAFPSAQQKRPIFAIADAMLVENHTSRAVNLIEEERVENDLTSHYVYPELIQGPPDLLQYLTYCQTAAQYHQEFLVLQSSNNIGYLLLDI